MGEVMRRSERQLSGQVAAAILGKGSVCHLAMVTQGEPYLVTMNYGFRAGTMYFHCADAGKKLEILKSCARVCFTVVPRHELMVRETGCGYSMKYESVVGHGTARFISEPQEKREALEIIMAQYADGCFDFPGDSVARTTVFVVAVEQMTAKSSF